MVRSPNPIFPFFQLCGLSIPTNPTTKPSPSRELDGAEIFHNPKKNPIISPVLALYPVLNPSEKGKNQTPCPHCGDAAGDNNLEMPWNVPGVNPSPCSCCGKACTEMGEPFLKY